MMRCVCLGVIGAMATIAGLRADAAPRPRGKVVRIERTRSASVIARICEIRADKAGTCLGNEPEIGEIVTVLAEDGVVAEVQIIEAVAFSTGGSATGTCQSLWNIKTALVQGSLAHLPLRTIGVVGPQIHPRDARMMPKDQFPLSPSGRADEQVMIAIDRDGDRAPDLVLTQVQCDGANPLTGGSCLDEYVRVNNRMVRVQQTNFAGCGF